MRIYLVASITMLAALSVGCSSDASKEGCTDDTQCRDGRICVAGACEGSDNNDVNGATNMVTNNAVNNDDGFLPTTITLIKDIDADSSPDIYYHDIADCSGGFGWFTLWEGDTKYRLQKSCGACECDELPECEPLGCPAICAQPSVLVLNAGDAVTYEWPGYHWVSEEQDGAACEARVGPTGSALSVEFCFSRAPHDVGPGELDVTDCEVVEFSVGDADVELRLQ